MKAKDTHSRVSQLKQENEMLEERIKLLSKELTFLKDIFLAHAGTYVHTEKVQFLLKYLNPFGFQILSMALQLTTWNCRVYFKTTPSRQTYEKIATLKLFTPIY